jgi:hypothetical protein
VGLTAFGGALLRTEDGWYWRDGRCEPRVRDLLATEVYLYPRLRSVLPDGTVRPVVELPPGATDEEPALRDLVRQAGDRCVPSRDRPGALELPEALWDAWAEEAVDEPELLALARSLGALIA